MPGPEEEEEVALEWDVLAVAAVGAAAATVRLAAVAPGTFALQWRPETSAHQQVEFYGVRCATVYRIAFFLLTRYGPPVRTDHRLIVENLSSRISWQVSPLVYLGAQALKHIHL